MEWLELWHRRTIATVKDRWARSRCRTSSKLFKVNSHSKIVRRVGYYLGVLSGRKLGVARGLVITGLSVLGVYVGWLSGNLFLDKRLKVALGQLIFNATIEQFCVSSVLVEVVRLISWINWAFCAHSWITLIIMVQSSRAVNLMQKVMIPNSWRLNITNCWLVSNHIKLPKLVDHEDIRAALHPYPLVIIIKIITFYQFFKHIQYRIGQPTSKIIFLKFSVSLTELTSSRILPSSSLSPKKN